jgi:hypothetical protein
VRRIAAVIVLIAAAVVAQGPPLPAAQEIVLGRPGSLKMAVIGDFGTGERPQYDVGRQMAAARDRFPFDLVLLLGDNMYGRQEPADFITKFQQPYKALIDAGVRFQAALGNHDRPENRFYPPFNMNGERYYTFARQNVRFVVLDTNVLDAAQLNWAESTLAAVSEPWRIVYFHHPLYSDSGRHGSNVELRVRLEPLLVRHGVQVVFAGHDHVYERVRPQQGITHFLVGSGGQLRRGDVRPTADTAAYFDQDNVFALIEIAGDELYFQAISRGGVIVDAGVIRRPSTT